MKEFKDDNDVLDYVGIINELIDRYSPEKGNLSVINIHDAINHTAWEFTSAHTVTYVKEMRRLLDDVAFSEVMLISYIASQCKKLVGTEPTQFVRLDLNEPTFWCDEFITVNGDIYLHKGDSESRNFTKCIHDTIGKNILRRIYDKVNECYNDGKTFQGLHSTSYQLYMIAKLDPSWNYYIEESCTSMEEFYSSLLKEASCYDTSDLSYVDMSYRYGDKLFNVAANTFLAKRLRLDWYDKWINMPMITYDACEIVNSIIEVQPPQCHLRTIRHTDMYQRVNDVVMEVIRFAKENKLVIGNNADPASIFENHTFGFIGWLRDHTSVADTKMVSATLATIYMLSYMRDYRTNISYPYVKLSSDVVADTLIYQSHPGRSLLITYYDDATDNFTHFGKTVIYEIIYRVLGLFQIDDLSNVSESEEEFISENLYTDLVKEIEAVSTGTLQEWVYDFDFPINSKETLFNAIIEKAMKYDPESKEFEDDIMLIESQVYQ